MPQPRTALSPNFVDVQNAVLGGGPFVGPAPHGTIVRVPPNGAANPVITWPSDAVLIFNQDISIIGAGMDKGNAIPDPAVATIIKLTSKIGAGIRATYQGTDNTCRISGIVFELTTAGNADVLSLSGRCYRHRDIHGDVVGGLRVDNIRYRNTADDVNFTLSKNCGLVSWAAGQNAGNFITGSYDHNFVDYKFGSGGSEVHDFACIGSPTGTVPDKFGQWKWSQPYSFGGGDDTDLNTIFIEDNIIHRGGFAFGTVGGGANIVVRHNTSWAAITEHGTDTGGNMGAVTMEVYNNYIDVTVVAGSSCTNTRGGAYVSFNNRFTNGAAAPSIAVNVYRPSGGSFQSGIFGPATGRNFFDKNERGPITVRGNSYTPLAGTRGTPTDTRIGSVYAEGTVGAIVGKNYTLTGLNGTIYGQDTWKGFILVNTTNAAPESQGDQGLLQTVQKQCYGIITSSSNASNSVVTLTDGANLAVGHTWEIRKINQYFCHPGAGQIVDSLLNGGQNNNNTPNTGDPDTSGCACQTSKLINGVPKHKYFPSQVAFGVWQKGNMSRPNSTTPWNSAATPGSQAVTIQDSVSPTRPCYAGGVYDNLLPSNRSTGGGGGAYPTAAPTAANLRVGADWQAPGFTEGLNMGDQGAPTQAYGGVYPNLMVTGGVSNPPTISSLAQQSFVAGTGGTFQCTYSGFSSAPIFSKSSSGSGQSFPATGTTFSSSGLLTVGASSAAGTYLFTITAQNGAEIDTQDFTLIIGASTTKIIALSGSLDFGDHDLNTSATKSFVIANNGNTVLTVTNVTLPAGYTADWTSGTIQPGVNHSVNVTFTASVAGSANGTATVVSDKTSGTNTLPVTGFGATRIIGVAGNLAFGNVTVGQTATRQLTISNTGNRALSISAISYPAGFSGDFTTGSIAAGANKILNVTFAPTATQAYSGAIDIASDKTSGASTVSASGTGVSASSKIIQLTGDLNFGNVQVGTSVVRVLTITNSGNSTLAVSGIAYPAGFTGAFSGNILAGASQNVNVTFSPVSAIGYGGTVTVSSDATGGLNTTSASGTGVAPATKIIGLSGSLDFGAVLIGSSSTRTLVITNTGSAPLAVSGITYPAGFTGAFSGTIAPGASQNVTVTFSPTATQSYDGTITVASDSTSGTNTIPVTGSGVAPTTRIINLTGNLAFGNVQKQHTAQRIMVIHNSGTAALAVSNITCPAAFTVDWSSGSIQPGQSQNVQVTFSPTANQAYGGVITVVSNKTSGINTIACTGRGRDKKQVPFCLIVG